MASFPGLRHQSTDIKPRVLSTAIDLGDATASLDLAFQVAPYFELPAEQAIRIAGEVGTAVSDWRNVANSLGLTTIEIERMASAFEHADLKRAVQLVVPA
jgi:serine/threonine-protein kinase HipA